MNPKIKARRNFIINAIYYMVAAILIFVAFKYIPQFAMPFVVSFLIALVSIQLAKVLQRLMNKKCKSVSLARSRLTWKISAILSNILIMLGLVLIIATIVTPVVISAIGLVKELPSFYNHTISPGLSVFFNRVKDASQSLGEGAHRAISEWIENGSETVKGILTSASEKAFSWTATQAMSLPNFVLQLIVTVISSFFITIDYKWILNTMEKLISEKAANKVRRVSISLFEMIFKFLRSYLLIMLITFLEISFGLWIAGVPNPFLFGLLIAIFDIFPLVGSGMVLLPWAIISFAIGKTYQGIVIFILYVIVVVVREIIEPKIVGTHVGLKPIVSLVCMYVGSKLFGVVGLFGLPIVAAIYFDAKKESERIDMEKVIETKRLYLRVMTEEDREALASIISDPETMKYYPKPYDEAGVDKWLKWCMGCCKDLGYGLWAVCLKDTDEMIGDCGITRQNINGEILPEVGYHIHKRYWLKGYAKEAAKAVVDWGFTHTDYPALYSYCNAANKASYKTAESIGMSFKEEYETPEYLTHVSWIKKEDWEKKRS